MGNKDYEFGILAGPQIEGVLAAAGSLATHVCGEGDWTIECQDDLVVVHFASHGDWFAFWQGWSSL